MKFATAAALTVLLGCLAPPAEAQTSARIVVLWLTTCASNHLKRGTPSSC